jgi:hypothetical protein
MKIKYKIIVVKPNIFAVIIKEQYDRAMLFCRAKEYYECPNKKFRGKAFSIWDYMQWYASDHNGFSYADDWSGFNIPFDVILECYEKQHYKKQSYLSEWETPYDEYMYKILSKINKIKDDNEKCYVIGAEDTNGWTFQHEVCHGLWHTNPQYKKESMCVLNTIDRNDYAIFKKNLLAMGYTDKVIDDEIQAYLCFGHNSEKFCDGVDIENCREYNRAFLSKLNEYIEG